VWQLKREVSQSPVTHAHEIVTTKFFILTHEDIYEHSTHEYMYIPQGFVVEVEATTLVEAVQGLEAASHMLASGPYSLC
jgi:hypothetical protein